MAKFLKLRQRFKDGGNKPKNKDLYNRVKSEAKSKFRGDWPSAYGSAWLVREYKKRGGTYEDGGLKRWFKEEWTNQEGKECGSGSTSSEPKCRPSKRISDKTPKTWGEMSKSEKKKAVVDKNKATKSGKQFGKLRFKRSK